MMAFVKQRIKSILGSSPTSYTIIGIGDIHGKGVWRKIVEGDTSDNVVFMGDYFDAKNSLPYEEQLTNFMQILSYKRDNRNKVVLLIGNHDFHYFSFAKQRYDSYITEGAEQIQYALEGALREGLLQICFVKDKYLFSHAGFSRTWCRNSLKRESLNSLHLERYVNSLLSDNPDVFEFTTGENFDLTGDDVTQSPLWIRPKSLWQDRIQGFVQVVGHTESEKIVALDGELVIINTLGTSGEYIRISDGQVEALTTTCKTLTHGAAN